MSDVIDRHVVVLAPEERNIGKPLPLSEHVARCRLALALGHHPVLDPQILAGVAIGPPRDVAGGKDARDAGLEIFVHGHASIGLESRTLGELDSRPHADADNDEVGRQCRPLLSLTLPASIAVAVSSRWNTTPCSS